MTKQALNLIYMAATASERSSDEKIETIRCILCDTSVTSDKLRQAGAHITAVLFGGNRNTTVAVLRERGFMFENRDTLTGLTPDLKPFRAFRAKTPLDTEQMNGFRFGEVIMIHAPDRRCIEMAHMRLIPEMT